MCLKTTLSNVPAPFPTSFLPLLIHSNQEKSKMGVCGCLFNDSLLGARKRKLLTWKQRKHGGFLSLPETEGASGLGGIEAGTKEARWLMENGQRRGEKRARDERRRGIWEGRTSNLQTSNAGKKREQSPKTLEEVQRLGFKLWRLSVGRQDQE